MALGGTLVVLVEIRPGNPFLERSGMLSAGKRQASRVLLPPYNSPPYGGESGTRVVRTLVRRYFCSLWDAKGAQLTVAWGKGEEGRLDHISSVGEKKKPL